MSHRLRIILGIAASLIILSCICLAIIVFTASRDSSNQTGSETEQANLIIETTVETITSETKEAGEVEQITEPTKTVEPTNTLINTQVPTTEASPTAIPPTETPLPLNPKFEQGQGVYILNSSGTGATSATVYDGSLGVFSPPNIEAVCDDIADLQQHTHSVYEPHTATPIRKVLICPTQVYYYIYMTTNDANYPYEEWDARNTIANWGGWIEESFISANLNPVGLQFYLPPGQVGGLHDALLPSHLILSIGDSADTSFPGGETTVTLESAQLGQIPSGVNCQNCLVDLVVIIGVTDWGETASKEIFDLQGVHTVGEVSTFPDGNGIESIEFEDSKLTIRAKISQWADSVYLTINTGMQKSNLRSNALATIVGEDSVYFYFTP